MINTRQLLGFIAWMSLLAGLSVAKFPPPYQEIATLIAWSIFLIFSMHSVLVAVSNLEHQSHQWTGVAIFAISITIILTVAQALNARTPGTIVLEIFGTESPLPPPLISLGIQPPQLTSATSVDQWLGWEYYTNTMSSVVDLASASIVTLIGGLVGARYSRSRGITKR